MFFYGLLNNNKKKYKVSTQLFFYNLLVKSGYYAVTENNRKDQNLSFNAYTFKNNLLKSFTGYDVDLLENLLENDAIEAFGIKEIQLLY
jgi:hypothetical protein